MLIFDIESDGLLDTITKIHCLVIKDDETGEVLRYEPDHILDGVNRLQQAIDNDVPICGHNIISFDVPAIQKLYPSFKIQREKRHLIVDTLVLSRLLYANVKDKDMSLLRTKRIPPKLYGRHSLEAWGYRIGNLKGTYAADVGEKCWEKYSIEMLTYCEQDVLLTHDVYEKLMSIPYSDMAIELEHQAQWLMFQQEQNGFPFDREKAEKLECVLRARKAVLEAELLAMAPPIPAGIFVPKRDNKTKGYQKGVPIERFKEFNPNSRQQIEWIFRHHFNYSPRNEDCYDMDVEGLDIEEVMQKCRLLVTEETFDFIKEDLGATEEIRHLADIISENLMLSKRLGQLSDGKNAWLKMIGEDGYIHGHVNPNGAVTGRATHSSPNVAQVPAVRASYGKECRELFTVPKGWIQVGVDACGLELRCLAHFLFPYDDGKYGDIVLNGDIHTMNQEAAGLPTRDLAKTFIYGWLYGAGDAKVGKLVQGTATDGKRIKREFLKKQPALKILKDTIQNTLAEMKNGRVRKWKRHYLKGLDGRHLYVRSLHSALNTLLQSAGALICKKWIVETERRLVTERGLDHGKDFMYMAWIHDEIAVACRTPEIAQIVIEESQNAIRDAQSFFNFRVRLDTEGKVGKNWAETH